MVWILYTEHFYIHVYENEGPSLCVLLQTYIIPHYLELDIKIFLQGPSRLEERNVQNTFEEHWLECVEGISK